MNTITFEGRIREGGIMALQQGVSQVSGKEWKSRDFIMDETNSQYPQSILLRGKGEQVLDVLERLDRNGFDYNPNTCWRAHISFEAHSYKKKDDTYGHINDVTCWKLEMLEGCAK